MNNQANNVILDKGKRVTNYLFPLEGEGGRRPDEGESKTKNFLINYVRHPLTCPSGHPLPQGRGGTLCGFPLCCHDEFISASSRYDNNKTLKQVQGDGVGGFTLIELLVVVLIIGILAAVALPQYQLAVVKSKVATMLPIMRSIAAAEEVYYLTNGEYTTDSEKLEVSVPTTCQIAGNEEMRRSWTCGSDFFLLLSPNQQIGLSYCPGNNNVNLSTCQKTRDFVIVFTYDSKIYACSRANNSALGQKICNSLALH